MSKDKFDLSSARIGRQHHRMVTTGAVRPRVPYNLAIFELWASESSTRAGYLYNWTNPWRASEALNGRFFHFVGLRIMLKKIFGLTLLYRVLYTYTRTLIDFPRI
jgi:hypothetical protein